MYKLLIISMCSSPYGAGVHQVIADFEQIDEANKAFDLIRDSQEQNDYFRTKATKLY